MKAIFKQFVVHFVTTAVCVAVLAAGFLFLRPQLGARGRAPAEPAVAESEHATVELEEFTVNLADVDRARYVKTTLALEVTDPKTAQHVEEKLLPRVRDAIIITLSKQYFRALNTADGKQALKEQLVAATNDAIPPGHGEVVDIMFMSLVMQ